MSPLVITLIALGGFLVFMFFGLPVPISMLLFSVLGIALIKSPTAAFQAVSSEIFQNFTSYTLTVAPMFGLMGFLASFSGIGESLFNVADKYIGHKRGGIAAAVQVACGIFGAICGSIPATMGTMVSVALPEMNKRKYDVSLSTAAIVAGAGLAVLIPPSFTMIVYGAASEESIGRLFIAGIIPGIILMLLQIFAIKLVVKRNPEKAMMTEKATRKERLEALRKGGFLEVLIIFLVAIGGMFIGWFTPTEAASVGAMSMLILGLIEKRIDWKKLIKSLISSCRLAAVVFFMLSCGSLFGRLFALSRIPTMLAKFVAGLNTPAWVIMLAIIFIYFIMGMFIDGISIILITVPIFTPILSGLGFDGIWYGVLIVLVLVLGGLTPPVGINVFYMKGFCKDVPLHAMFSGVWPFVACTLLTMIIIAIFPATCTWLPTLLYGA